MSVMLTMIPSERKHTIIIGFVYKASGHNKVSQKRKAQFAEKRIAANRFNGTLSSFFLSFQARGTLYRLPVCVPFVLCLPVDVHFFLYCVCPGFNVVVLFN